MHTTYDKKFIEKNGLSAFPIGLGGCRTSDLSYDSCDYDLFVFDEKSEPWTIFKHDDKFVNVHHASLSETNSEKLLQYHKLEILQDESWDLQMMLSKINKKHVSLFSDFAKNCLIESQFCCQKTTESIQNSDVFAPCWQKCDSQSLVLPLHYIRHQFYILMDM